MTFLVATTFVSQAQSYSISVPERYLADANFPDALQKVIYSLDRSPQRITTVIGTYLDCQEILVRLKYISIPTLTPFNQSSHLHFRDVNTQILWLDPSLQLPTHTSLSLQSLVAASDSFKVVKGFFTFAPPQSSSLRTALVQFLNSSIPTQLTSGGVYYKDIITAYDLMLLWSSNIAQLNTSGGNVTNRLELESNFLALAANLPPSNLQPSELISAPYAFHQSTGNRVGQLNLINWQLVGNTTLFVKVGSWSGATTDTGASLLTVNSSAIRFADGTSTVPPPTSSATITLGVLLSCTPSNSTLFPPVQTSPLLT